MRIAAAVGLILGVPLAATLFTDEVRWGMGDFVLMGVLLFGAGAAIDFAARKISGSMRLTFAIGAILAAFFLIWAELAVGAVSQAFKLFR